MISSLIPLLNFLKRQFLSWKFSSMVPLATRCRDHQPQRVKSSLAVWSPPAWRVKSHQPLVWEPTNHKVWGNSSSQGESHQPQVWEPNSRCSSSFQSICAHQPAPCSLNLSPSLSKQNETNSIPPNKLDSDLKYKSHLCSKSLSATLVQKPAPCRRGEGKPDAGGNTSAESGDTYVGTAWLGPGQWCLVGGLECFNLVLLQLFPAVLLLLWLLLLFVLGLGGAMGWGAGAWDCWKQKRLLLEKQSQQPVFGQQSNSKAMQALGISNPHPSRSGALLRTSFAAFSCLALPLD